MDIGPTLENPARQREMTLPKHARTSDQSMRASSRRSPPHNAQIDGDCSGEIVFLKLRLTPGVAVIYLGLNFAILNPPFRIANGLAHSRYPIAAEYTVLQLLAGGAEGEPNDALIVSVVEFDVLDFVLVY